MNLRKYIVGLFSFILLSGVFAQEKQDTTIGIFQELDEFRYIPNYKAKYARALRKVKKVYPLALHAKFVIDSMNAEIAKEDKRRKQKKVAKTMHKDLKNDFKFLLKELYVSEGKMLAKLIHRETGLTVYDIIKTYKSKAQADLFAGMAGAFDQDLKTNYLPNDEDYITERVIENIWAGLEPFDSEFVIVDKAHYKNDRKQYRANIKSNKAKARARKKLARKKK